MNGWCPREARVIKDLLDHDPHSVLYLAQLDRSGQLGEHQFCDDSMCRAHQINNAVYRTKHVDSGCECNFLDVTNECRQSVLVSLIEPKRLFGKIHMPKTSWMITFVDGIIKPVSVSPYKIEATRTLGKVSNLLAGPQMTHCVAISHVWSDGLGNTERNALPECQVSRLQVCLVIGHVLSRRRLTQLRYLSINCSHLSIGLSHSGSTLTVFLPPMRKHDVWLLGTWSTCTKQRARYWFLTPHFIASPRRA